MKKVEVLYRRTIHKTARFAIEVDDNADEDDVYDKIQTMTRVTDLDDMNGAINLKVDVDYDDDWSTDLDEPGSSITLDDNDDDFEEED